MIPVDELPDSSFQENSQWFIKVNTYFSCFGTPPLNVATPVEELSGGTTCTLTVIALGMV